MTSVNVELTINGRRTTAAVEPRITLVDFLRDTLDLTGTHVGCEHGVCGACSVLLNGEAIRSCLMFAVQADGMSITTIEGLGQDDEPGQGDTPTRCTSDIQDAFWETHGLQCGYCTPGMIIATHCLLTRNPDPSDTQIREAIEGNLCRCTGYVQIVEAVRLVAKRRRDEGHAK